MKKLIILSAVTFLIAAGANAQIKELLVKNDIQKDKRQESLIKTDKRGDKKELRKLEGSKVSYFARQQFYRDFGDVPVSKWERMDNYDEATYSANGQTLTAFYDADAQLVGTTSERTFSDLPIKAQEYIHKKYPDYKITDVLFYDDNELNETDMVLYNIRFDDVDSYFVELKKENKEIVLQAGTDGTVSLFTTLNY